MTLSERLRSTHARLWEQTVRHPFVLELGDGSLPLEKFRRYFLQDYLFVGALSKTIGLAVARAPDLDSAGRFHEFLGVLLGAEDALFLRGFEALGVPENEFRSASKLPTTAAFADFLVRLGYEGTYREICTALYVAEAVYLDWAERLRKANASPGVPAYQEWIDIHTEEALGPFVRFLEAAVDTGPDDPDSETRLGEVFQSALRHELRFWEMAYHGESWESF